MQTVNTGSGDLSAGRLASRVQLAVNAAARLVADAADLDALDPLVVECVLDGDTLLGVQMQHAVHELLRAGLEERKDRVTGVRSISGHFAGRVLLLPFLEACDVVQELLVRWLTCSRVPERTREDDDEVDHSARPDVELSRIVRT